MKKALCIISVVAIMVVCAVFAVFFFVPSTVNVSDDSNAELTYIYNDKNISVKLSDDERDELCDIFNGKERYVITPFDTPSCGFTDNVSVKIGNTVFKPACDTCATVETGFTYFQISEEERAAINRIFQKYGGTFPCV